MSLELKIKAKSLADEARTIRLEERRLKKARQGNSPQFQSIYLHRIGVVRREARATHLARAFLAGTPYRAVERETRCPIVDHVISRVVIMVRKYGREVDTAQVVEWLSQEAPLAQAA